MSCSQFTTTSPACRTITVIEPDDTLLTATSSGSQDQSLDESGITAIPLATPILKVNFATPKASADYRFEYLYVDAFGQLSPGAVVPIVTIQTLTSFTVDFAGIPLANGYVLKWRVVVHDLNLDTGHIDFPENVRQQIPQGVRELTLSFVNPRSDTSYPFSELRIENLIDDVNTQRYVVVQVVNKTQVDFTVGFSTPVITDNYFLVARTP